MNFLGSVLIQSLNYMFIIKFICSFTGNKVIDVSTSFNSSKSISCLIQNIVLSKSIKTKLASLTRTRFQQRSSRFNGGLVRPFSLSKLISQKSLSANLVVSLININIYNPFWLVMNYLSWTCICKILNTSHPIILMKTMLLSLVHSFISRMFSNASITHILIS